MKRTKNIPMLRREAPLLPDTVDLEKRTVDLVWTTGARVLRYDWWTGEYFYEELSLDPAHVRMQRLQSGNAPLLDSHDDDSVDEVLGVIENASLETKEGRAKARFSKREDVAPIWGDVVDKIIRNTSCGYTVYKFERQPDVPGETIPVYLATDWEPHEISLVAAGADVGAGVRSQRGNATTNECVLINNLPGASARAAESIAPRGEEERQMPPKTESTAIPEVQAAATSTAALDIETEKKRAAESATQAERTRVKAVREACRTFKLDDKFADDLVEKGVSIDGARALIQEKLASQSEQTEIRSQVRVEVGAEEGEKRVRGIEAALLHRHNPVKYELSEHAREYRGMGLIRLAEEILGSRNVRGLGRPEIAKRALASSDFKNVLANVAYKTLLEGFLVHAQTFKPLVVPAALPDFKEVSRVKFGDISSLEEVGEGAEYTDASIGDDSEKYKLAKYGKIVPVTWETIVNDDLNAFARLPMLAGSAVARIESKLFWNIFLSNPKMSDNVALFHADHGNLLTAAAISETSANLAKAAIRKQKTLDGEDFLDIEPKFLIVGPDKEMEARKLLSTTLLATKSGDVNTFAGSMTPLVEPRITGTKWFLSISPDQGDTIEHGRLEGMEGPQLETKEDFDADVVKLKIKHVVGFKALDYRGFTYNPGA